MLFETILFCYAEYVFNDFLLCDDIRTRVFVELELGLVVFFLYFTSNMIRVIFSFLPFIRYFFSIILSFRLDYT